MNVGAIAHSNANFGGGSTLILLDGIKCFGTESTLLDCPNHGIGIHSCGHHEDAGVECISEMIIVQLYVYTRSD